VQTIPYGAAAVRPPATTGVGKSHHAGGGAQRHWSSSMSDSSGAGNTRCMGRNSQHSGQACVSVDGASSTPSHHLHPSLRTSTLLASNRPQCHTQRTHARALGGAQHSMVPAITQRNPPKFGISGKRGLAPHRRHVQPGEPRSSFGTYLALMQLSADQPQACTSWM
jgi:hypothetical protein